MRWRSTDTSQAVDLDRMSSNVKQQITYCCLGCFILSLLAQVHLTKLQNQLVDVCQDCTVTTISTTFC